MIGDLIGSILGGIWGYVAAAGGALALLVGAYFKGAAGAKNKIRAKQAEDALARAGKGRSAVANAKRRADAGETPEDIARKNDGRWQ